MRDLNRQTRALLYSICNRVFGNLVEAKWTDSYGSITVCLLKDQTCFVSCHPSNASNDLLWDKLLNHWFFFYICKKMNWQMNTLHNIYLSAFMNPNIWQKRTVCFLWLEAIPITATTRGQQSCMFIQNSVFMSWGHMRLSGMLWSIFVYDFPAVTSNPISLYKPETCPQGQMAKKNGAVFLFCFCFLLRMPFNKNCPGVFHVSSYFIVVSFM